MNAFRKKKNRSLRGVALIMSMIFIAVFSVLALTLYTVSSANVEMANNHHKSNAAMSAALSGLECAKYIIANYEPIMDTTDDAVTQFQADATWDALCSQIQLQQIGGQAVPDVARFTYNGVEGDEIITPSISFGQSNASFRVRFYRYDADPYTISFEGIGSDGTITRRVSIDSVIEKDTEILSYGVASKGGMVVWSGSRIEKDPLTGYGGNICSFWDEYTVRDTSGSRECESYVISSDSVIEGVLSTLESSERWNDPDEQDLTEEIEDYDERIALDESDEYQLEVKFDEPLIDGFEAGDFETADYKEGTWSDEGEECINVVDYARNYGDNVDDTWPVDGTPADERRNAQIEVNGEMVTVLEGYWNDPEQSNDLSSNGMQFPPNHNSPREYFDRPIFIGRNFDNITVPKGTNPLFIDCTFDRITYVDVSEDQDLVRPKMSKWNQASADWTNSNPDSTPKNTWSNGQIADSWNDAGLETLARQQ